MSHAPEPTNRDIFEAIQNLQVDVSGLKIDVRGLREDLNDHIKWTRQRFDEVDRRFDEMFDVMRGYAGHVDLKFDSMDQRVTKLEKVR